jgi:nitrous oxide reductase accessory protein NosL
MLKRRIALGLAVAGGALLLTGAAHRWWPPGTSRPGPDTAPPDDICLVAPPFSFDPASGLPVAAARAIPEHARCPVCGMFPARQPRWAAQVIFANGDVQYLDSPLSLFLYLQNVARYTVGQQAGRILAMYVTDLDSGAWVPAEQAVYVHGSRTPGPMRSGNLPAFASVSAAEAFIARQGGTAVRVDALRRALPVELRRQAPHRHSEHGAAD